MLSEAVLYDKLAEQLGKIRAQANLSQAEVAKKMHKAKGTIQNWEQGVSAPDFIELMQYISVAGASPQDYIYSFLYPNYDGVQPSYDDSSIKDALLEIVENLPTEDQRALLYMLCGRHGTPIHEFLQLILAYLHNPLSDRAMAAQLIFFQHKMNIQRGTTVFPSNIQPDMELLKRAIRAGTEAAINGKLGYISPAEE